MSLSTQQIEDLQKPLDGKHVKKKPTGFAASYLEGWFCIAEANRIFGHDGWHRETVELRLVGECEETDNKGVIKWKVGYLCRIKITVTGGEDKLDICREGVGFGNGEGKSRVDAHELAAKESETDGTKRALMTFGWPFGLALYDKKQEHVENNGSTPVTRTLATPMSEHAEQMAADFPGDRPQRSNQAIQIGNLLASRKTLKELNEEADRQRKIIASLHKVDRDYLNQIRADQAQSLMKVLAASEEFI